MNANEAPLRFSAAQASLAREGALDLQRRTRKTAWIAAAVALGMLGAAYASVPLYRLFCQLTGFDGTPIRAKSFPAVTGEHRVAVQFNAETARGMPWIFRPVQREVTVKVGGTVTFTWGSNASGHNVAPDDGEAVPASPDQPATKNAPFEFTATFNEVGEFFYYCTAHGGTRTGMFGKVNVVP